MGIAEAKMWLSTQVSIDCVSEGKEVDTWESVPQWLETFQCYMNKWAKSSGWGADGGARAVMAAHGHRA
jgi:hypothetical protein